MLLKESDLNQFTGTLKYYTHWTRIQYTDGIKFLAEQGEAYWLIDAITSYQTKKIRRIPFQVWELKKTEKTKAILTMKEDTNQPELIKQEIPYTDFPLNEIKLYLIDGILLLPSEY